MFPGSSLSARVAAFAAGSHRSSLSSAAAVFECSMVSSAEASALLPPSEPGPAIAVSAAWMASLYASMA